MNTREARWAAIHWMIDAIGKVGTEEDICKVVSVVRAFGDAVGNLKR